MEEILELDLGAFWRNWLYDMIFLAIFFLRKMKKFSASNLPKWWFGASFGVVTKLWYALLADLLLTSSIITKTQVAAGCDAKELNHQTRAQFAIIRLLAGHCLKSFRVAIRSSYRLITRRGRCCTTILTINVPTVTAGTIWVIMCSEQGEGVVRVLQEH
jgi:hypothetical protein